MGKASKKRKTRKTEKNEIIEKKNLRERKKATVNGR